MLHASGQGFKFGGLRQAAQRRDGGCRPVPSKRLAGDVFLLGGEDIYDRGDEEWEFEPGNAVEVIEKEFAHGRGLLAVRRAP